VNDQSNFEAFSDGPFSPWSRASFLVPKVSHKPPSSFISMSTSGWFQHNPIRSFAFQPFSLSMANVLSVLRDETPLHLLVFNFSLRFTQQPSTFIAISGTANVSSLYFPSPEPGLYLIDILVTDDGVQKSQDLSDFLLPSGDWDLSRVEGPKSTRITLYLQVSLCSTCSVGYFPSSPCNNITDTVCSPCSTTCGEGNYISSPCSHFSDIVCSPCSLRCPSGSRMISSVGCPGYFISDIKCTPCSSRPNNSVYEDGGCTGLDTSDFKWSVCPSLYDITSSFFAGMVYIPKSCAFNFSLTGFIISIGASRKLRVCSHCPKSSFISKNCTTKGDTECTSCVLCSDNQYEINPCGEFQSRTCGLCMSSNSCKATTEYFENCTGVSPGRCLPRKGFCSAGTYLSSHSFSLYQDTQCQPCDCGIGASACDVGIHFAPALYLYTTLTYTKLVPLHLA